jgi:hypothetical protein
MSAEAFTPEWLTEALRSRHALSAGRVVTVTPSSLGEGFGLLGSLARLALAYDRPGSGAPASLIAKFPAAAEMNRNLARQYRVYEREYRFYREVAPTIATRVPRAYYLDFEPATGDAVILLEDLAPARVGDQLVEPAPDEVERAITEMVKLHVARWGKADGEELTWVPALRDPIWQQVAATMELFWPSFQENFGHLVSPGIRAVGDAFAKNVVALLERLSEPPQTLLHGDFRLDNLFFATGPGEDPPVVIDWQLVSRGKGPYDLAYFLSQSLEPARRAATEREILRQYHEALLAGGVTDYTLEDCLDDYRHAILLCMMYPIAAGGGMDLSNERGRALATAMATRSFAAIEAWDAGRLIGA